MANAIFIISGRAGHFIPFVKPLQQVAVLAALAAKRFGFRLLGLAT
jgi:hypothetical protein